MKIEPRAIENVLSNPHHLKIILLYGDDAGLIRERAKKVVHAILPDGDDPFRLVILDKDRHPQLEEEAYAMAFGGGKRLIWVRETSDNLTSTLKTLPDRMADALILLEGSGLNTRSKLKLTLDGLADCGTIGCYAPEGQSISKNLKKFLARHHITCTPEALSWCSFALGNDTATLHQAAGKLALYAGDNGHLTLEDVQNCIENSASPSLEEAAFAASIGDRILADRALENALVEGTHPVAVARSLLYHFQRLMNVQLACQSGLSNSQAMSQLRPPVFFKRQEQFSKALTLWSIPTLKTALNLIWELELACKQSASPDIALTRRLIAVISQMPKRKIP